MEVFPEFRLETQYVVAVTHGLQSVFHKMSKKFFGAFVGMESTTYKSHLDIHMHRLELQMRRDDESHIGCRRKGKRHLIRSNGKT